MSVIPEIPRLRKKAIGTTNPHQRVRSYDSGRGARSEDGGQELSARDHLGIMPRPDGWESRFAAVLEQARTRPFDAREWNCALFARACVQAITGREIPARLSRNLESTVDTHFPRIERALARPGYVVLAEVPHKTLGVCTGRSATFLGASGLYSIPMSEVLICWKV
jgi:hypothetical protein